MYIRVKNNVIVGNPVSIAGYPDIKFPDSMTDEQLMDYGWYPVRYEDINSDIQRYGLPVINPTEVVFPAINRPIKDVAETKKAIINSKRQELLENGTFTVNGNTYDHGSNARNNLGNTIARMTALVTLSGYNIVDTLPIGFSWRTVDNQDIVVTPTELILISEAMWEAVNAIWSTSFAKKNEIETAIATNDFNALAAVVWD